jgi:hypothetical protein
LRRPHGNLDSSRRQTATPCAVHMNGSPKLASAKCKVRSCPQRRHFAELTGTYAAQLLQLTPMAGCCGDL